MRCPFVVVEGHPDSSRCHVVTQGGKICTVEGIGRYWSRGFPFDLHSIPSGTTPYVRQGVAKIELFAILVLPQSRHDTIVQ